MNTKRLALIAALILAIVGFIVFITSNSKPDSNLVFIEGLGDCSEGINDTRVTALEGDMYGYVSLANKVNKVKTAPTYDGTVRKDGCGDTTSKLTKDYDGKQLRVYSSSAVVDIPEAKQSWQVRYDWVKDGGDDKTDLGELRVTCLPADKLTYGDFKCDQALSLKKYGTTNYDPILQYMPYSGEGFNIDYRPDTKQVTATISIPLKYKGDQEVIDNRKQLVPYWFQKRNLDPAKYNISYNIVYQ
jgi:hypothetical protein